MCYLLPRERLLKLLSLYPDCASWIASRALHRRNYFRNVELTLNVRFGVDSRFDFLRALSLNPERKAQFDELILRKVNSQNQGVNEEPYEMNFVRTLADSNLTQSTSGYEIRNMVPHRKMQIDLLTISSLNSLMINQNT